MPEPDGPQFNRTPDREGTRYQRQKYYGNRFGELSEGARGHVNRVINSLASYGGAHGLSDDQIKGIIADPGGQHGPFFDTPEKQADAIDRVLGFDPHMMQDFWEGDENPDMNEEGPNYDAPDPFGE